MLDVRPHIMVIDPAMRIAELDCFNQMQMHSPLPLTYHLPSMFGIDSLAAEDMASVRGIVILGSASSVNERAPWQSALESWLMPQLEKKIPTLGICYGHQMLAHMFGGRVDYMHPDREKFKGMRTIELSGSPWWMQGACTLVVSHNEAVVEAPPSMTVMAKSANVAIDGLQHRTLPIYSLQPHPEATPDFLRNHAIPGVSAGGLNQGHALVRAFLKHAAASAS